MTTLLRKLSVKGVCGPQSKPASAHPLMRVWGSVTGVTTGYSEQVGREWIALTGMFEAVNLETGELFTGPKLFLPDPAGQMLASAIAGSPNTTINFAVEVGIKPTSTAIGYEYTVKDLVEPKPDARMLEMRERFVPQGNLLSHDAAPSAPKKAPQELHRKR